MSDIDSLIADLSSDDGIIRQRARNELVDIGAPAVEALITALDASARHTHWEAAKALSLIGDSRAVQSLIKMLEEDDVSIRWMAAEGLITIGRDGLKPLLRTLGSRSNSVWLREGAHHVLNDLVNRGLLDEATRQKVMPVIRALDDVEPAVEVQIAAHQASAAL